MICLKKWMAAVCVAGLLSSVAVSYAFAATKSSTSKTRLGTISDMYWGDDGTTANWEELEDAYQYEIRLYLAESQVASAKTKKVHYDWESKMTKAGEYTFKVRALAKSNSKEYSDGSWSDSSEETYIDEAFAERMKNGEKTSSDGKGPGESQTQTGAETSGQAINTDDVSKGAWIQEQETGRWWYRNADGSYPMNGWWKEAATEKWYYFDAEGYMQTGWIEYQGNRYYCAASGEMVVGDQKIDEVPYHFEADGRLMI